MNVEDKAPLHPLYIGPEKLLSLYSENNWGNFCLSYLLTNRDYSGVLGLAWEGKTGGFKPLWHKSLTLCPHSAYKAKSTSVFWMKNIWESEQQHETDMCVSMLKRRRHGKWNNVILLCLVVWISVWIIVELTKCCCLSGSQDSLTLKEFKFTTFKIYKYNYTGESADPEAAVSGLHVCMRAYVHVCVNVCICDYVIYLTH